MPSISKTNGVVYTPAPIVELILDQAGLHNPDTLAAATICEPACGDGAILRPLAHRILQTLPKHQAIPTLQRITAIDIDAAAVQQCRHHLQSILNEYHPQEQIDWQVSAADATLRATTRQLRGKFTHVVGNPPYVRVQNLDHRRDHINHDWYTAAGATDLYIIFFELALNLLAPRGTLTFITPNSWLTSHTARFFRQWLIHQHRVDAIIDFRQHRVFPELGAYTAITSITKDAPPGHIPVTHHNGESAQPAGTITLDPLQPQAVWTPATVTQRDRIQQIMLRGPQLGQVADIHIGIQTLADDVFILAHPHYQNLEPGILRPIVKASVMHNGVDPTQRRVIFPYTSTGALMPESTLASQYPNAYHHLNEHRETLVGRDKGKTHPHHWYAFGRNASILSGFANKIVTPPISPRPNFQLHPEPDTTFYAGYCIKPKYGIDHALLLDVLNSEDMDFFIDLTSKSLSSGWMHYSKAYIQHFPIPRHIIPAGSMPIPLI